MTKVNGLTEDQYTAFRRELRAAPCTREAIDALYCKWFASAGSTYYPDEWYTDKDNRLRGAATGYLSCLVRAGGKMVWRAYSEDEMRVWALGKYRVNQDGHSC